LRLLEEEFYRHKKADFMFFLLFCMFCLLLLGPFFGVAFLGSPLIYAIVYLWSKRNPFVMMNFLGLFNFTAPYLPFVLFGFSLLISNQFPLGDFLGIVVGHVFFFLADVYPRQYGGRHLLHTPLIL
jgi:Derlin-2/3